MTTFKSSHLYRSPQYMRIAIVSLCLLILAGMNQIVMAKNKFSDIDVQNLCSAIKSELVKDIPRHMDTLINKAGISKEQWNTKYVYKVDCSGVSPLFYSLQHSAKTFKAFVDYGIDLNHPIIDDKGNVSTVKDYVRYKAKTLVKYIHIYEIIKKKKAKGCNDLPELNCTANYPYATKMGK